MRIRTVGWREQSYLLSLMSRVRPNTMTCTISEELLAEVDDLCWENRVTRSEFVREALKIYLKHLHIQSAKIESPNEEALVAA